MILTCFYFLGVNVMQKRKNSRSGVVVILFLLIALAAVGITAVYYLNETFEKTPYLASVFADGTPEAIVKEYADSHNIAYSEYTE